MRRRGDDDGFFFFLMLILVLVAVGDWDSDDAVPQRVSEDVHIEQQPPPRSEVKLTRVDYAITWGTVYTGTSTPRVYSGTMLFAPDQHLGLGPNGLPITGYFPSHTMLSFVKDSGVHCTVRVPAMKSTVVSLLSCDGAVNRVLVLATVQWEGDHANDYISVQVAPATEAELGRAYVV